MTAKTRRTALSASAGRLETALASIDHLADAIFDVGQAGPMGVPMSAINAVCRLAWEIDTRTDAFVHGLRQVQTMPWPGAPKPYPRPDCASEIANGMYDDLSAIRDFAYTLCALSQTSGLASINRHAAEIMRLHAAAEGDFALFFGALHGRAAAA